MYLKKLIFASLLLCLAVQASGQLEHEINTYSDSTEHLIRNGRKLLLDELRLYNYAKAHDVYALLNTRAAENQCEAFSFGEHIFITLLTSDWEAFFRHAASFNASDTPICYRSLTSISQELFREVETHWSMVQGNIQAAEMSDEERTVLGLLDFGITRKTDDQAYAKALKAFHRTYPASAYSGFVKGYLPSPPTSVSMTMSLGPIFLAPQGDLGKLYNGGIGFGVDIDFCINRFYLSLAMGGGTLHVYTPFTLYAKDSSQSRAFVPGDKFNYTQIGVKGGYYVVRSRSVHLAPYLSIGSSSLHSDIYPSSEDNNKEWRVFSAFAFGPGIHAEVKLFGYKERARNQGNFYSYSPPGYFSLKFDAGYNTITQQHIPNMQVNMLHASLALVWGIGHF